MFLRQSLLALTVSLTPTLSSNIAVEESNTGAILSFPDVSDGDLYNVTWEVEPAAFGYADYGGTLEAYLVLPANKSMHTECDEEEDDINDYVTFIQTYQGFDQNWVLVIDRGDCYFATKVYNAERMGASGVIMLDYKQEGFIIMWEPDDFEHDVNIPSVMLKYDKSQSLMKHLGVKNWNPKNMINTTYPEPMGEGTLSNNSFTVTKAIIEWGLPHDDDRVEWELWTSSNDDRTMEFKNHFKATSIYLNDENYTLFTPHYYILNGAHWNCDNGKFRCGNQCTNSGRYCAVDPEKDLDLGISGMDVVQEDLRQLCIWNYTTFGNPTIHNESVWWDYSVLWNDMCFNDTTNEHTFNTECSYRQMSLLEERGAIGLQKYVNNCIETSGGYGYEDGNNTILDYEVTFRESESIHVLPTFRVNEFMIYGEVDCEQVTEDGCAVLDSICSGFIDGTQPPPCFITPSPTMVNCSSEYKDCAGICYGSYEIDRCGDCTDPDSTDWNSCVDCANVTNGTYELNGCDFCGDPDDPDWATQDQDCRGPGHCSEDWGWDECGKCLWIGDDDSWNSCVGCDGVADSNATWKCGLCVIYGTDDWQVAVNECEEYGGGGGGGSSNNGDSSAMSTIALIIGLIAFLIIILAGIVIYRLHKKQKDQSKAFENILKTYSLMDENPSHNDEKAGSRKTKKREKIPENDVDELDIEEENNQVV